MSKLTSQSDDFTCQEIPLNDALHVIYAGDGKYAKIKEMLLQKLPLIAPDKAFAFGLSNGEELPESNRRSICAVVNMALLRARLNWRITYSGMRKSFICIPRTKKTDGPVQAHPQFNGSVKHPTAAELVDKARTLFGYTGNFKGREPGSKVVRKAISVVGINDLGLKYDDLVPLLGISRAGIYWNARMSKSRFGMRKIKALQKAVHQDS